MPDRCDKYPSMDRRYCAHCQGTAHGTRGNPNFSIKEDEFNGYAIIEVLKDGGPIHEWDRHFRFGLRKAEVLLAALPVLKQFAWTSDEERHNFPTQIIRSDEMGISVQVFVEMHPDFVWSTGELIERPYLQLVPLPPASERAQKGLGAMKCKAICAVQDDLRAWVRGHRRRYMYCGGQRTYRTGQAVDNGM